MSLETVLQEIVRRISILEKRANSAKLTEGSRGIFARRPYAVTLSGGAFSYQNGHTHYLVTSETGTSDDLTTIDNLEEGAIIVISAASGHTITAKDGTGNLSLNTDRALDSVADKLLLMGHDSVSAWCELSYSDNA